MESIKNFLNAPFDEAIDARRNQFHVSFIQASLLGERLSPQAFRPEVVIALSDLAKRHRCLPLSKLALRQIRQGSTPDYGLDGPPCLKLKQVQHILIDTTNAARVSANFARNNQRSVINSEAVFINRSGGFTVGRNGAYLRPDALFVSDDVFVFVPNELCDAGFITCFLNSWWGKRALEAGINGSTGQLKLPQSHVAKLPVPQFSLDLQNAIGDKVRKVDRLRELARQEWNDATSALEQQLNINLSPETFNRFTASELTDAGYDCRSLLPAIAIASVGGELGAQYFHPRRIHACRVAARTSRFDILSDIAPRIRRGKATASGFLGLDAIDSVTGVIDFANLNGNGDETGCATFAPNDLLFSRLRPYLNKVAIWPESNGHGRGSGELLVYRARKIDPHYLFFVAKSQLGLNQVVDVTAGSTHPRVDGDVVDQMRIPRLDEKHEARIGQMVRLSHGHWYDAQELLPSAKADIESLIDGTLDEQRLLEEGEEISAWLAAHPVREGQQKGAANAD